MNSFLGTCLPLRVHSATCGELYTGSSLWCKELWPIGVRIASLLLVYLPGYILSHLMNFIQAADNKGAVLWIVSLWLVYIYTQEKIVVQCVIINVASSRSASISFIALLLSWEDNLWTLHIFATLFSPLWTGRLRKLWPCLAVQATVEMTWMSTDSNFTQVSAYAVFHELSNENMEVKRSEIPEKVWIHRPVI